MYNLKLSYSDIQSMPWEFIDWYYNRHLQYLIDKEKAEQEKQGHFL